MEVNFLAVVVAAVASFFVGGIWYGPLFAKTWMKENGFSEAELAKRNMAGVFGFSFLFALISAFLLAMFVGADADFGFTMFAALSVGLGWVTASFGVTYLFEAKSFKLFLINAGYHVVSFAVMGLILSLL